MAIIKSYSDISQSKKLAKILPLESADMGYLWNGTSFCEYPVSNKTIFKKVENIPCWSLAALFKILGFLEFTVDKISKDKSACMVSTYIDGRRYDSMFHYHAVDACYALILKLHELKLL